MAAAPRRSGWIPWAFVAAFAVVVGVDATMIGLAVSSAPGVVADHAYERGRRYNAQLSAARANAVKAALTRSLAETGRVTAEGRADADPVAPNTTAEGREQNRRIEIVLRRQD